MRTPAALIACPLFAGCAAGITLADTGDPRLPLCAAAAAALSWIAAAGFFADRFPGGVIAAIAVGCALSGVSLGMTAAVNAYRPALAAYFDTLDPTARDEPLLLEGEIRDDAAASPGGVSLTLNVRDIVARSGGRQHAPGGVRLTIAGVGAVEKSVDWRAGRILRLPVLLRRPTSYLDPGVADDIKPLARRGVALLGTVKSAALVEIVQRGSVVEESAAAARRWCRVQLARHVGRWSAQSAAIAAAILIGDRSGLSDEDERRLQEAGTFHVIAISGGNIAILTAVLLAVMRLAAIRAEAASAATIAALLFYAQIASGGGSVTRAVTAACLYLGSRMLDHRGPALNALAVAGGGGLAAWPLAAFDGGFLLSFGATLGILVGIPRMARGRGDPVSTARLRDGGVLMRRAVRWAAGAIGALLLATVCAEIALAPVSAVLFSRITLAGLALNFLAIPLMTVAQIASLCTLALAVAVPELASGAGYLAHVASYYLVRSAALVDLAPWLSRDVTPPVLWLVAGYYGCCALMLTRRYVRAGGFGALAGGALMLLSPAWVTSGGVPGPAPGVLRIAFLDVGQGDSTMVRMPDGRVLLVDAAGLPGSSFDVGDRVVGPALRALGVRRIDTLVLTHGDPDHVGGAASVLRRFAPRTIWEGVPVPPHAALRELASRAALARASWRTLQSGDREAAGGAEIRVLHPPPPEWERQRVRNEDSVVLEIRFGGVSIVLPGDIGQEAERRLTPGLETGSITIVKAPHHGSATSSTDSFLRALHPAAVVFSAGRGNRFGHPAPAVVARYRALHALVFRTDEDGAVLLDTDGKRVELRTWSGRRVMLGN